MNTRKPCGYSGRKCCRFWQQLRNDRQEAFLAQNKIADILAARGPD